MSLISKLSSPHAPSSLLIDLQGNWTKEPHAISSNEIDLLIQAIFTRVNILHEKAPNHLFSFAEHPALRHQSIRYLKDELQELETHKINIQAAHVKQKKDIESSWNGERQSSVIQLIYWICKSILLWQVDRQFGTVENYITNEIENVVHPNLNKLTQQDINASRTVTTIACHYPFYLIQNSPNEFDRLLKEHGKVLEKDLYSSQSFILSFSSSGEIYKVYIELTEDMQENLIQSFNQVANNQFILEYIAQAEFPDKTLSPVITPKNNFKDEPLELYTLLSKTSAELSKIFTPPSRLTH